MRTIRLCFEGYAGGNDLIVKSAKIVAFASWASTVAKHTHKWLPSLAQLAVRCSSNINTDTRVASCVALQHGPNAVSQVSTMKRLKKDNSHLDRKEHLLLELYMIGVSGGGCFVPRCG